MKLTASLKQTWTALIVLSIIVPVTIITAWLSYHHYIDELNMSLFIERRDSESLQDHIESKVDHLKTLLHNKSDSLSLLLDKTDILQDTNSLLITIVEREPAIREVMILTEQGDVIAAVDPMIGLMGDVTTSQTQRQVVAIHWGLDKALEQPEIIIPLMGRDYIGSPRKHDDFIAFSISTPIGNPAKAILLAIIDVATLLPESEHGIGTIKTRDYILDRRGSLITEIEGSTSKPGDLMTHLAITRAALINEEWPAETSYVGVNNQPVFGTVTTIPILNWALISEAITNEILAPIYIDILRIIIFSLSITLFFVLLGLFLAHRTLKPIHQIGEAINKVAQSDYRFNIKPSGIRELDAMAGGFNNMVKRVLSREQAISNIAMSTSKESDNSFFQNMANNIGKLFNTKHVFIGLLDTNDPLIVNTLAVSINSDTADNISYNFKDTPCETVLGQDGCAYSDDIQQRFPKDPMLEEMGVNSYIGTPIFDSNRNPIGLIVIMDSGPLHDLDHLKSTLEIFSTRASAELERMSTEEALRESEVRFRQLAENINQVFWLGSSDWKQLFYVSPAYETIWGQSIEDLYKNPQSWFEAIHPDDKAQVIADMPEDSNNIIRPVNFREYRIQKPDGEVRWIKARGYPISNGNKLTRIAGIAEDITEFKHQREQFNLSQKMNALGKLTGGVAHDYNNMLGIIMGYAELLASALSDQPKLAEYAHEINHAGERGARLTKKLLTFSSKKTANAEVLNLNALLKDQQLMLEKTLTARIQLVLNLSDDLWPIYLDTSDLENAIINMSINALHAMEDGGRLTIQTTNEHLENINADMLGMNAGDYVLLSVTDTGHGIDNAIIKNIFDPFYTTKGEKGTGLGLSQVYGFIERSNGAIKIYSEPEHGSQFVLYFPRHNEEINDNQLLDISDKADLKGAEIILLVDDEPALLEISAEILSRQGYTILRAESGQQALDILEKEPVDLLLSDVIMPEMDGYELATLVQKQYPDTKIQLTSGFTHDRHISQVNESLHQNLLHKPCNSKALLQRMQALLNN